MKLCCATQMFQKHGLAAAIETAARCGFDSLDLWASPGRALHVDPALGREHFASIRQQVETHGLHILSLTAYGVHSPEQGLSGIFHYLSAARDIGAKILVTGAGAKKGTLPFPRYLEYLRPLVHKAADGGIVLAIENHINSFLETPEECIELVDRFGSRYLGIAYAGHHFHSIGRDPQAVLEQLDHRVRLFYAWDKKPGSPLGQFELGRPEDQIPGRGQLDFRAALQHLQARLPDLQPVVYWRGAENWELERLATCLAEARTHLASWAP